jgi:ferric-dicitrate binding protein FerR (iron transport regulator)
MALQKVKTKFIQLVKKVISGKASANEQTFVENYYNYFEKKASYLKGIPQSEKKVLGDRIYAAINERISAKQTPVVKIRQQRTYIFKAAIAAAVLLVIYIGIDLGKSDTPPPLQKVFANNFNTITTPKGSIKKIVLPDGTMVWINAASTLRYPAVFSKNERIIELNGEAYFEVAHNAKRPFKVKVKGQTVEVMGTHFNLMAYDDEPVIKTALMEGKVKVSAKKNMVVLNPGQQSVLTKDASGLLNVTPINGNDVLAWKSGKFYFNQSDIRSVMREISRWYDMEIDCKDTLQVLLNGSISRNVPLERVLKIFELTGEVKFTVLGKRIKIEKR